MLAYNPITGFKGESPEHNRKLPLWCRWLHSRPLSPHSLKNIPSPTICPLLNGGTSTCTHPTWPRWIHRVISLGLKMLQRASEQRFLQTPHPFQRAALSAAHFLHPFQFITPSPTCIILPATHSLLSLGANLLVEAFWLHLPFKSDRLKLDIFSLISVPR